MQSLVIPLFTGGEQGGLLLGGHGEGVRARQDEARVQPGLLLQERQELHLPRQPLARLVLPPVRELHELPQPLSAGLRRPVYKTKLRTALSNTRILGKTMRDAARNKERGEGRRTPTQYPNTHNQCTAVHLGLCGARS